MSFIKINASRISLSAFLLCAVNANSFEVPGVFAKSIFILKENPKFIDDIKNKTTSSIVSKCLLVAEGQVKILISNPPLNDDTELMGKIVMLNYSTFTFLSEYYKGKGVVLPLEADKKMAQDSAAYVKKNGNYCLEIISSSINIIKKGDLPWYFSKNKDDGP